MSGIRKNWEGRSGTVLIVLILVAVLVSTAGVATADSLQDSGDDVPDPLEAGTYEEQTIDPDETVVYEAQLDENDYFAITTILDSSATLDATMYGPGGSQVGEVDQADGYTWAWLLDAPTAGTYTVEIYNPGSSAETYDLDVVREEIRYVDEGSYSGQVSEDDFGLYAIELEDGESLSVTAAFDGSAADIDVGLYDETLENVDHSSSGGDEETVEITDPTAGTYYFNVYTIDGAAAEYDLDVAVEGSDGGNDVPEPLDIGFWGDLSISGGESIVYETELTEADYFSVAARFDSTDDLEVRLYEPDGTQVGSTYTEDDRAGVEVMEADAGTYYVEIYNPGSATTFDLEVYLEWQDPNDVDGEDPYSIPQPLEEGQYPNLAIDEGEGLVYEVELTGGDFLAPVAMFDGADDLEVVVYDPDGNEVGNPYSDDGISYVEYQAEQDGIHSVQVINHGEATTFDFEVHLERQETEDDSQDTGGDVTGQNPYSIPQPLEQGQYDNLAIDDSETVYYEAELTAGDEFAFVTMFDSSDDLEVTVYDPNGNEVGERYTGDDYDVVELMPVERDGTYVVEVVNRGESTTFDLEVYHDEADPADDADGRETESADGREDKSDESEHVGPTVLEDGRYHGLTIQRDAYRIFEVDVTAGDELAVVAFFDSGNDLEVTVYGPDGTEVGEPVTSDTYRAVEVQRADASGTHYVEVYNPGDATTYDFEVYHTAGGDAEQSTGESSTGLDLSVRDVTAVPGEEVTIPVTIAGGADATAAVLSLEDAPEGWNVTDRTDAGATYDAATNRWLFRSIDDGMTLEPSVTVAVPEDAEGEYDVTYALEGAGNATATATVTVASETTATEDDRRERDRRTDDESDAIDLEDEVPGFTPVAALLALALGIAVLRRRH